MSVGQFRLHVKNTFISVEDVDVEHSPIRWRSESQAERWRESDCDSVMPSECSAAKGDAPEEAGADEGFPATVGPDATIRSSSWADVYDDWKGDSTKAEAEQTPIWSPGIVQPPRQYAQALEADAVEPPPQHAQAPGASAQPSLGSICHPHLCSRPCRWFATASCADGVNCGFCHCEHRRSAYLDKRNRETVRRLSPAAFASLLTQVLTQKVAELRMAPAAARLLWE